MITENARASDSFREAMAEREPRRSEHDPEKRAPVFGKAMYPRKRAIMLPL
jgi:hypothetical protein